MRFRRARAALLAGLALPFCAVGAEIPTLNPVEVIGSDRLLGTADSANQGTASKKQLEATPAYRPGEVLETVPGLIITQHSGEGKANQYFLRGFNLDHGTDFAIMVDGVPINLRTHGHGQGYADLSFLIPELAAAGAARVLLSRQLPGGIAVGTVGTDGYRRALVANSPKVGGGNVLYALEVVRNDGPWTNPDDYRKVNAVLRYSAGDARNGYDVTAMAYHGKWNSTDQIPKRAVDAGQIGRFDAIDPTDGGDAHRYALSAAWRRTRESGVTEANAYVVRSDLKLFSNFTYFMNDPVNGDQFEQNDKRTLSGVNAKHTWFTKWGGRDVENSAGIQLRNDSIDVGLFNTVARQRSSTTRADLFAQNTAQWLEKFRTIAGLRADYFQGKVSSDNAANSGDANDHAVSPKLSLVFGPWQKTEYYLNYGRGFHSNDLRGATITVDPATGTPAQKVPLLVHATGYEAGVRTEVVPKLQAALSLFRLDVASDLVFVGDAGTTEASRPSRRTGFELSTLYAPLPWLLLDADVAFSRARFTDPDPAGSRIPGAVEGVATLTAAVENLGPWYGSMRLRYFGPRPLIENNSVRSPSTTLVSARAGYKFARNLRAQLDIFNLLDRRASQIDYFYASQLRGEAAPVSDVHSHPAEPRSFRASVIANF